MRTGEHADLRSDGPDIVNTATICSHSLIKDRPTHRLLFDAPNRFFDVLLVFGILLIFRNQSRDHIVRDPRQLLTPLLLISNRQSFLNF